MTAALIVLGFFTVACATWIGTIAIVTKVWKKTPNIAKTEERGE